MGLFYSTTDQLEIVHRVTNHPPIHVLPVMASLIFFSHALQSYLANALCNILNAAA